MADAETETGTWGPIRTHGRYLLHFKTHVTVLLITIVAEAIGSHAFNL